MPASFLIEAVGGWENSARPGPARLTKEIKGRCGPRSFLSQSVEFSQSRQAAKTDRFVNFT